MNKATSRDLWLVLAPILGLEGRSVVSLDISLNRNDAARVTIVEHLNLDNIASVTSVKRYELVEIGPEETAINAPNNSTE